MKNIITIIAMLLMITSCRTITTYHYEDTPSGGKMFKDDGSNEVSALWINTSKKHLSHDNWLLLQKEKNYFPAGYNYIIYDTLYSHNNKTYHLLKAINNNDTIVKYFLIHTKK